MANNVKPNEPISEPSQVSNFRLKASYWYVTNKFKLRKLLIFSLIFFNVGIYVFAIGWALAIYFIDEPKFNSDMAVLESNLTDYSYWRQAQKAKDLQILEFYSTDGREGKYDLTVKIKNPNPDYYGKAINLDLYSAGEIVESKQGYILPNEEKYFTFFGQKLGSGSPEVSISKVAWKRVDYKFQDFSVPRLRFEITDINYKSAADSNLRGKLPISTLNFKIKNNTGYSYWQVGVQMILLSAQQVVGSNYITLENFISGQTKEVEMVWYENMASVNKIQIIPEVDILNPNSYMKVQ